MTSENSRVMRERGAGNRMQRRRVRVDGEKRKGQVSKKMGAGGVGFLVNEYLCDVIEVI